MSNKSKEYIEYREFFRILHLRMLVSFIHLKRISREAIELE